MGPPGVGGLGKSNSEPDLAWPVGYVDIQSMLDVHDSGRQQSVHAAFEPASVVEAASHEPWCKVRHTSAWGVQLHNLPNILSCCCGGDLNLHVW